MNGDKFEILCGNPKIDGFKMPAEWAPHLGTIITWPYRIGTWGQNLKYAYEAFAKVINTLILYEKVFVVVSEKDVENVKKYLNEKVEYLYIDTNDSWVRDNGPTFVTNGKTIRGVNWKFNAWGGSFNGLFSDYKLDDEVAIKICNLFDIKCYDFSDFVLEGGSIHTDGEGTLLVTESCLLSKGRNPQLSKSDIEKKLKDALGVDKILWIPNGIYNDETDGHVDNMCAFVRTGEVVLAWTDNMTDPQYKLSKENYDYLSNITDAKDRRLIIHKIPIPDEPILITEGNIKKYQFNDAENDNQTHEIGTRMPASYINYYVANGVVLVPQFGGKNKNSDRKAIEILSRFFSDKNVIGIEAKTILMGGGNIHCITQQIPKCNDVGD